MSRYPAVRVVCDRCGSESEQVEFARAGGRSGELALFDAGSGREGEITAHLVEAEKVFDLCGNCLEYLRAFVKNWLAIKRQCEAYESGRVRCELQKGHGGEHACPQALTEFDQRRATR